MLVWIKHREKNLAHTAMAMLVGGWLLVFCQLCLASVSTDNGTTNVVESEEHHPCHSITTEPEESGVAENHCLGVCDCDDLDFTLNFSESNDASKKLKSLSIDASFEFITVEHRSVSGFSNQSFNPPERAILLPFTRYTVLLN